MTRVRCHGGPVRQSVMRPSPWHVHLGEKGRGRQVRIAGGLSDAGGHHDSSVTASRVVCTGRNADHSCSPRFRRPGSVGPAAGQDRTWALGPSGPRASTMKQQVGVLIVLWPSPLAGLRSTGPVWPARTRMITAPIITPPQGSAPPRRTEPRSAGARRRGRVACPRPAARAAGALRPRATPACARLSVRCRGPRNLGRKLLGRAGHVDCWGGREGRDQRLCRTRYNYLLVWAVGCLYNDRSVMSKAYAWRPRMIASQRRKHYYGHDDPNVPPVTVGPDIVSDIYYDIGDCNTPISGYPILYPILTPISGVTRYCIRY